MGENNRIYTVPDLKNFPAEETWEILQGVPFRREPFSPGTKRARRALIRQLTEIAVATQEWCSFYPEGIVLPDTRGKNNYVVPLAALGKTAPNAAVPPRFMAEIIGKHPDMRWWLKRYLLYESLGVKEYWLIYPEEQFAVMYSLNQNSKYEMANSYGLDEFSEEPVQTRFAIAGNPERMIDFATVFDRERIGRKERLLGVVTQIAAVREQCGLSQGDLAKLCRVSPSYIARLESGNENPKLSFVIKLLNTMGYSMILVPKESSSAGVNNSVSIECGRDLTEG